MKMLRVGHVGGRTGYAQLFNSHPHTKTVAICDVNLAALEEKRRILGSKSSMCLDFNQFIKSDFDVVVVAN